MHLNIRSLSGKINELEVILEKEKPDVLVLTETWTSNEQMLSTKLNGYDLADWHCRHTTRGGGVCIFIKNIYQFGKKDVKKFSKDSVSEFACCKWLVEDIEILILGAYRAPNSDVETFLNNFSDVLNLLNDNKNKKRIAVCGDFNIDMMQSSTSKESFVSVLSNYNIEPVVKIPTRVCRNSATLIDNIITNMKHTHVDVVDTHISDHSYQLMTVTIHLLEKTNKCKIQYKDFNVNNINLFNSYLEREEWNDVYVSNNLNDSFLTFYNTFLYYFNMCFATKTKIVNKNKKNRKAWVTDDIKFLSNYMKDLCLLDKQKNCPVFHQQYTSAKKTYAEIINVAKKTYTDNFINNAPNKTRAAWHVINSRLNENDKKRPTIPILTSESGDPITDPVETANIFNKFFIESNDQNFTGNIEYHGNRIAPSMFLNPITEIELLNTVATLKAEKSQGTDGIPGDIIKKCIPYIISPLLYLINLSFEQGEFPNILKSSKITPVYKNKGDPTDPTNYRPIAVQNQLAKIFEKLFHKRLIEFLEKKNILSPFQHGFTKNRNTETALYESVKYILDSLDNKKNSVALFFDFSRAFDTVQHDILFYKLEQIGVRGVVQKWIQSYVSNRQQIVKFSNGAHSQSLQNKVGVPQGSLLAPTLFLIMNNDLPLISPEDTLPVLYADDSNFVSDIENAQQIANNMQTWAATNCQSLNYGKTQFIHFTPRNKIENQSQLIKLAHGTSIKQVSATKFLGVHLDSKLNWSTHIETLCKNLNSLSFLFRQLRPYTSDATLLTLYYGQCYSKLVYGIVCWGNAPKVQSALIAQKNIIRQIENCSRRHSCKPLFLKYNLLTIVSIYILACSTRKK